MWKGARTKRTLDQFEEADKGWKKEKKDKAPVEPSVAQKARNRASGWQSWKLKNL